MGTPTPIESIPTREWAAQIMVALSKARAMTWVLAEASQNGNNLTGALNSAPEETREWLTDVVADGLRAALDDIEAAARRIGYGRA